MRRTGNERVRDDLRSTGTTGGRLLRRLAGLATLAVAGTVVVASPAFAATDLSVTITDGQTTYLPGQWINYTIVVHNGGPDPANNARLQHPAPTGFVVSNVNCSATGGASCPSFTPANMTTQIAALQGGTGLAIPTLPNGGTATFVVSGAVDADKSGSLAATATITPPAGFTDVITTNNTATDTDTEDGHSPLPVCTSGVDYVEWAGTYASGTGAVDTTATLVPAVPNLTYTTTGSGSLTINTPQTVTAQAGTDSTWTDIFGSPNAAENVRWHLSLGTFATPDVHTMTFASPVPAGQWGFLIADNDVEQIKVEAFDASNVQYSDAEVSSWYRGVYDAGTTDGVNLPRWVGPANPFSMGSGSGGDPPLIPPATPYASDTVSADDTDRASVWFAPDMPVKTLRLSYQDIESGSTRFYIASCMQPRPTVRIDKVSEGGVGTFGYAMTGLSASTESLTTTATGVPVSGTVRTATVGTAVTVNETSGTSGYSTSVSCTDENAAASGTTSSPITATGTSVSIPAASIVAGAEWVCTYTNIRLGTITIVKDAQPNDAQDFTFSTSGTGLSNFSLDDDADATLSNTRTFNGLTPGSFTVTESSLTGWTLSNLVCVDPDAGSTTSTGTRTATIDLDAGETITCTFTNVLSTGSLGDAVFLDQDGDGSADPGEGIAGVDVTVTWLGPDGVAGGGDDVVYSATTDGSGTWSISDLPAGNFTVSVDTADLPPYLAGAFNSVDPDGGNDSTASVTLASGESNDGVDFGYVPAGSVSGTVFHDVDGDGMQDPGELGLDGVSVTAVWFGPDGVPGGGDDVTYTTTTDANGDYSFDGVPNGDVSITVDSSATDALGLTNNTGDPNGGGDSTTTVTVTNGGTVTDQDFGYQGTGSLGDTVFWDQDGDGTADPGEGVAGVDVTVTWLGPDGVADGGDDVVYSVTTDVNGNWSISDLPAGEFTVAVDTADLPPYLAGAFNSVDPDGGNDSTASVTLTSGESNDGVDFGYVPAGSVSGTVYHDVDGDGTQDPGDGDLSGIPVEVVWFGPDGVPGGGDDVTYTTTTDANGDYTVDGLPDGNFSVTVDSSATDALGLTNNTGDPNGSGDSTSTFSVSSGSDVTDQDFGYQGTGSLGDTVFWDQDGDGTADPGEGIAGVDVTVTWLGPDGVPGGGDDVVYTATTDGSGTWSISDLPAGNFTVTVDTADLPPYLAGAFNSVDPDGGNDSTASVTLTSGESNDGVDFGYVPAGSVSGTVFHDVDGDGMQDPGELGLEGVTVTAVWFGPDGVPGGGDDVTYTTTTDANGDYSFDGVPNGDVSITVDSSATDALGLTNNTGDPNGGGDSTTTVTVNNGGTVTDQDFGYQGTGSLGDTVFEDVDGDGVADVGEGIAGVDVTVTWLGPDGVAGGGDDQVYTATTDTDGTWTITDLPAGNFTVTVDTVDLPPALTINSVDPDGGSDSTASVTLTSGETNDGIDFGYRRPNVPPVAVIDDAAVCANTPISISVLANDTDADLDTLTLVSVSTSAAGRTPSIAGNDISYSPPSNFTGVDVFTYVVTDGYGTTTTGTVTVTVGSCGLVANDRMYFVGLGGDTGPGPGPGYYDRIVSVNQTRFSGQQLVIRLRDGFVPQPGDIFDVWTAPSMSGHFAKIHGRVMPNGVVLQVKILPDRVRLIAVRGHKVTDAGDVVDANIGDGTCATADGVCTLRAAVQEANALPGPDGIIGLAGQTTNLAIAGAEENAAATGDLDVTDDLTLVGQGSAVDANDLDRAFHVTATGALDANELTLRDGVAYGVVPGAGAVFNDGGSLTLTDVVLTSNEGLIGGGLGTVGGTTTLNRGVITGNMAGYGGGVGAFGNTVLDAVLVEGNDASVGGGGIAVSPVAQVTAREAVVRDNDAQQGGGIGVFGGGVANLTRTTVSGNRATTSGGGIYAEGPVNAADARVSSNTAPNGAGLRVGSTSVIERTTIDANTASVRGGGIENTGTLTATAVTIDANVAPDGAALAQVAGSATLVSVTVVGQQATGPGGGALLDTAATPLSLMNSIVSDNVVGTACSTSVAGITSAGWNHVGDTTCGFAAAGDVVGGSAVLGPLGINGGYAPTHRPLTGSPVINSGATSGCGAKDQRNWPRPRGGACEKGAIEL